MADFLELMHAAQRDLAVLFDIQVVVNLMNVFINKFVLGFEGQPSFFHCDVRERRQFWDLFRRD